MSQRNGVQSHAVRGFRIVIIRVGTQFKVLKDCNVVGVTINVVAREEHVPKVKGWHQVVNERARYYYAMLLLDFLPRIMVIYLIENSYVLY